MVKKSVSLIATMKGLQSKWIQAIYRRLSRAKKIMLVFAILTACAVDSGRSQSLQSGGSETSRQPVELTLRAGNTFDPVPPRLPRNAKVRLVVASSQWKFVRFLPPLPEELAELEPVSDWKAHESLSLEFKVLQPSSEDLRLEFANSQDADEPEKVALIRFELEQDGYRVRVREEPGTKQRQGGDTDQDFIDAGVEFISDHKAVFVFTGGLILSVLVGWIGLRLYRKTNKTGHTEIPEERLKKLKEPIPTQHPTQSVMASEPSAQGLSDDWASSQLQGLSPREEIIVDWVEEQIKEMRREVSDVRESLKLAESVLQEQIEQLRDTLQSFTERQLNQQQQVQYAELRALDQRVRNLQDRLELFAQGRGSGSPELSAAALRENEALQQRTKEAEQALIDFFRRGVPQGDALDELFEQSDKMSKALNGIIDGLKQRGDDSAARAMDGLLFIFNNLQQLTDELRDWRSQCDQHQVRLRFAIDVPAYETARQTIIDALADGLNNQIEKLQNPRHHFRYRLEQLATTGAMYIADVCDKELDPKRENEEMQTLLGSLFQAAGLEEIAPKRNEVFRPAEHSVVQLIPGRSTQDGSQTVAQLVARGFRYKGNLLRKASVMLFR
jgi:hypothetical protein